MAMAELVFGIALLFGAGLATLLSCIVTPDRDTNWVKVMVFLFSLIGTTLLADYRCERDHRHKIDAIEVYRGNTTLQVTYQDSIAIDSVVVYKKK